MPGKKTSTDRLETGNILPLLLEFSIPAMIGMLVNGIYNIVDRIFIGNAPELGATGLAAASITFPVMLVMLAFALMIGVGAATLFSISLGRKEHEKAEIYLGHTISLSLVAGLVFMVVGLVFIQPLLRLLGASDDVLPLAQNYLSVILYGGVFQILAISLNNVTRADGSPKITMVSMIIGAGFNILFDYILIVRFGLGMRGAAYATIGGQFLSMLWLLSYFLSGRSTVKFKLSSLRPQWSHSTDILKTGTPAFLMQLANSLMTMVLNAQLVSYGGDVAVSVAGIVTSATTMIIMLMGGVRQGMQPLVSYNTGARNPERVKATIKWGAIIGTIATTAGFIFIQLFPEFVIRLFNQEQAVLDLGVPAIRIWTLAFPLVGLQMVWASYFESVGEVRLASFLNLMRQIIFLIPLLFILGPLFGVYGLFFSIPIAEVLAVIATGYFIRKELYLNTPRWANKPKKDVAYEKSVR